MTPEGRVFVVVFSGIPGTGKSTFLKRCEKTGIFQKLLDYAFVESYNVPVAIFVKEPSKLWRQNGWLKAFYSDTDHYAAAFQLLVFATYVEAVENAIAAARETYGREQNLVLVTERSMIDQMIFWKQQVAAGCSTADAMYDEAYTKIWKRWTRFLPPPSVIFFFYTSSLQATMQRVKARARAEELGASFSSAEDTDLASSSGNVPIAEIKEVNGLTVDYQSKLLQQHYACFTEPLAFPPYFDDKGIPCKHVNVDGPHHIDDEALEILAKDMVRFFQKAVEK